MRIRLIVIPALAVLIAGLAIGSAGAVIAKKVGGSVTFSLTTPPPNTRDGQFSGTVSSKSFCRGRREVTLFPASDNFPNATGYIRTTRTNKGGAFSGTFTTPKKAGTSTFIVLVSKVRRRHNGKTFLCRALRAPGKSVTTTGTP